MRRLSRSALPVFSALVTWLAACPAHAQVVIAQQGDTAPGTGGGTFSFFMPHPAINDLGHVAFQAAVSGGTASQGIFLDAGSGLAAVAVLGDVAPDTGGGTFLLLGAPALNGQGDLVFSAVVGSGSAGSGLFRYSGGQLSAIATNLDMAPGTNGGLYAGFSTRLSLNNSGEVAFRGDVSGAGGTSSGIFVEGGSSSRAVFLREGATPAALPGTYFSFSEPSINAGGDVAALAGIEPTAGAFTTAVVVESGGVDEIVALIGDAAPDTGGGTYSEFNFAAAPGINAAREVFFHAKVTGGTSSSGLFVDSATTQSPVVVSGQPVPGLLGTNYFSFSVSDLSVNDLGSVGFSSLLSTGSQGIFVGPDGASAELLVRTGDAVPGTGGETYLLLVDNPSINAVGGAAFLTTFTGGTSAIIAVPELGPADSALVAIALLAIMAVRTRSHPSWSRGWLSLRRLAPRRAV